MDEGNGTDVGVCRIEAGRVPRRVDGVVRKPVEQANELLEAVAQVPHGAV